MKNPWHIFRFQWQLSMALKDSALLLHLELSQDSGGGGGSREGLNGSVGIHTGFLAVLEGYVVFFRV